LGQTLSVFPYFSFSIVLQDAALMRISLVLGAPTTQVLHYEFLK